MSNKRISLPSSLYDTLLARAINNNQEGKTDQDKIVEFLSNGIDSIENSLSEKLEKLETTNETLTKDLEELHKNCITFTKEDKKRLVALQSLDVLSEDSTVVISQLMESFTKNNKEQIAKAAQEL